MIAYGKTNGLIYRVWTVEGIVNSEADIGTNCNVEREHSV